MIRSCIKYKRDHILNQVMQCSFKSDRILPFQGKGEGLSDICGTLQMREVCQRLTAAPREHKSQVWRCDDGGSKLLQLEDKQSWIHSYLRHNVIMTSHYTLLWLLFMHDLMNIYDPVYF